MSFERETDYGTPASTSEETITLTIDGREVKVAKGVSVMRDYAPPYTRHCL